ncbi:putative lipase domain protein [Trypanosoma cruzi]|nr:hypothetical protein BCY84_12014 [Trypanosoma cruzi cruzi]RNF14298.1 putative lipase domain protein [Trypanosoma cruzi]
MNDITIDLANKQIKKNYVYGYDLYSDSVRKYYPVNDIRTAKNAILNNIHDYLDHLGEFETNYNYKKERIILYLSIVVTVLIDSVLLIGKDFLKPYPRTTYMLMGIAGLFCLIACFLESSQASDRVVFTAAGSSFRGNGTRKKDYLRALRGRKICVRVNEVPNSTRVIIEAQLVGPSRPFAASSVYYSVFKEVSYGRYFSKDGFFYPPPMVEDVDMLLRSLNSSFPKKRQ